MRKVALCLETIESSKCYGNAKKDTLYDIVDGMILNMKGELICYEFSELGETCFEIIEVYTNADICTMFDKKQFKDGDEIWIIPYQFGATIYVKNIPFIYNDSVHAFIDAFGALWSPEYECEWTVNKIHPWLR